MIVIVSFQFHDDEQQLFVMDTNKLGDTLFENDLKKALEGPKTFKELNGIKYQDDWGTYQNAIIRPQFPFMVDKLCQIHVLFDC